MSRRTRQPAPAQHGARKKRYLMVVADQGAPPCTGIPEQSNVTVTCPSLEVGPLCPGHRVASRSIANSERRQCERPEQLEADPVASRSCQRENRRRQVTGRVVQSISRMSPRIGIIFCAVPMLHTATKYWMYIKKDENGTSRVAKGSVPLSGLHSLVHTMHTMILFQMG